MESKGPLLSILEIKEKIIKFCESAEKVEIFAKSKISKSFFGEILERCEVEIPKMANKFPFITIIVVDRDEAMIISGDLDYISHYFWVDMFNHSKTVDLLSELEKFIE
jgi:hypothetical protein